ncbi:hypothetical protein C8R48DRAFT_676967 [Suillus tomentosus]|nr:hypothetical protein C8R48DRAFT_677628 [Suillus tomentosus]KAG1849873.1 hypothetical protein C8R48DRAFT_676967 [Suillus tomentosus]
MRIAEERADVSGSGADGWKARENAVRTRLRRWARDHGATRYKESAKMGRKNRGERANADSERTAERVKAQICANESHERGLQNGYRVDGVLMRNGLMKVRKSAEVQEGGGGRGRVQGNKDWSYQEADWGNGQSHWGMVNCQKS